MNITFITTTNHNVGDDFVREGIKFLIEKVFKSGKTKYFYIHKHSPVTVRMGFENVRKRKYSEKLDLMPVIRIFDKIHKSDLLIQSGAPVYWCHKNSHCSENEWFKPLIEKRFMRSNTILANIAAGTCQSYFSDGSEFTACDKDKTYIKRFFEISSLTTVRDRLSKNILSNLNLDVEVLPCTSIFANDFYSIETGGSDFIAMNYMKLGGHYDFTETIDHSKWEKTFIEVHNELSKKYKVKIICHNKVEYNDVIKILPDSDIFYSSDFVEYLQVYSYAICTVVNRVHGLFAAASFGTPGIVIGNDSRALMSKEVNLDSVYVNDANTEFLLDTVNDIIKSRHKYTDIIKDIKTKALKKYIDLFKQSLTI